MRSQLTIVFGLALAGVLSAQSLPASVDTPQQPRPSIYREIDGQELNAYVFLPPNQAVQKQTSAVILFHGGAWVMGSADWTFAAARRFAALGMVAIAVDYRLSQGKITPIEAVDDTRAAFRWVRRHAAEFHLDPKRVAGYGVSAGGQLVAVAAVPLDGRVRIGGDSGSKGRRSESSQARHVTPFRPEKFNDSRFRTVGNRH
jgi:acetyl esterase